MDMVLQVETECPARHLCPNECSFLFFRLATAYLLLANRGQLRLEATLLVVQGRHPPPLARTRVGCGGHLLVVRGQGLAPA